ncbi:hypothetical protein [uncultured Desulfovibrio sp.]|uniref:hypothetical protein n=1 Tax=uncultured Desulfovibrio sp. TaxID=167968 RepID=UPI0028042045|nr:hypothetical protein [uncultured Desulfovibrio sp.]
MKTHSPAISRFLLLLFLGVCLYSCAPKGAPSEADVEAKGREFAALSQSRAVAVVNEPYVGVKAAPIKADEQAHAALNTQVTLRKRGTLSAIASAIAGLTPLSVQVGGDPAPLPVGTDGKKVEYPDLPEVVSPPTASRFLSISYEGPLRGLLDTVAIASGYGWGFDARLNSVAFSRLSVRTFTILGAPRRGQG